MSKLKNARVFEVLIPLKSPTMLPECHLNIQSLLPKSSGEDGVSDNQNKGNQDIVPGSKPWGTTHRSM